MSQTRRMFNATQKADIVRRHLKDKIPVSQLADELNLQPTQIYTWIEIVLAQAERAFEKTGGKTKTAAAKTELQAEKKIQQLEAKLNLKNEVISELMEENVKAKKLNGDL